ncbi:MAG TPA: phosphate ABC transporter ATP-binding protein [Patescibacteria group bacterium]|nr:phosphate ABC transporter ATP-binding protein [Patescibacteria group bacterium]
MADLRPVIETQAPAPSLDLRAVAGAPPSKLKIDRLSFFYGKFQALKDITFEIPEKRITAIIGPSGCGKSTLLRVFNRMYDLVPRAMATGTALLDGDDIISTRKLLALRQKVGMVFQRPSPFPMSIRDNIAFAPKLLGWKSDRIKRAVEESLERAALLDEVKDRLNSPATALSGGQQQRLAIARCIAVSPEVILMDEPCSALDPVATLKIEDLMATLVRDFTIVIVTHNMQQAARVSDFTAYLLMNPEGRYGELIEFAPTADLFNQPQDPRTEAYITGRFG